MCEECVDSNYHPITALASAKVAIPPFPQKRCQKRSYIVSAPHWMVAPDNNCDQNAPSRRVYYSVLVA